VLPALILNYAGQVANFIEAPDVQSNPFFKLVAQSGRSPKD
jgi:KUP system potassium uptake protein